MTDKGHLDLGNVAWVWRPPDINMQKFWNFVPDIRGPMGSPLYICTEDMAYVFAEIRKKQKVWHGQYFSSLSCRILHHDSYFSFRPIGGTLFHLDMALVPHSSRCVEFYFQEKEAKAAGIEVE